MRSLAWALIQYDWFPYKRRKSEQTKRHQGCVHVEKRPCEDKERRLSLTNWGEKPQEKPNLPTPWSWTYRFQNCEKINTCCLSHPVCVFCYDSPSRLIYLSSELSGSGRHVNCRCLSWTPVLSIQWVVGHLGCWAEGGIFIPFQDRINLSMTGEGTRGKEEIEAAGMRGHLEIWRRSERGDGVQG